MTVLVLAEHNGQKLHSATLHVVHAAQKLGTVDILVAGSGCLKVAEQASQIDGVAQVLYADAPHYENLLAEEIAPLIVSLAPHYQQFAASANTIGCNIMPRVAALLDCNQVSDVLNIIDKNTFIRPAYAGNVLTTVTCHDDKLILTFRVSATEAACLKNESASIQKIDALAPQQLSQFVLRKLAQTDRPELANAKIIVAGGRSFGSAEQFHQLLTPLADTLNAAIGASRAAVDAEYISNDYQIGQTGKIIAPDLYIAIGISGAIQHIAGIQGSKTIVAINKDPDAAIFNVEDIGLVGDLFEVIPQLTEQLQVRNATKS